MQIAPQDLLALMAEDGARLQLLMHGTNIASLAYELAHKLAARDLPDAPNADIAGEPHAAKVPN